MDLILIDLYSKVALYHVMAVKSLLGFGFGVLIR